MKRSEYNTEQKRLIKDFLINHPEREYTVEELEAELASLYGNSAPSKSTVYRHITKLVSDGSVRRFESAERDCFVYQFSGDCDKCHEHFHLKCVKCGRLYHVECRELEKAREHISDEHNFIIGFDNAVLNGICKNCR